MSTSLASQSKLWLAAVSKEGKKAPLAKLCNPWVEEEITAAFAGYYAAYAWQTDLYLFYFLIFGPSKDKSSQVHCDCYFCNLAD